MQSSEIAVVFPGQGSQSIGMLAELAAAYPVVTEVFAEASAELHFDLWQLVQAGPESALHDTRNTQPAMLAAGVAVWRVWQAQGAGLPSLAAGHSLGEYTALCCAGALSFADAIRLVAERGRLMQDAVPQGSGAMAAILGLDDEAVRALCLAAAEGQVVEAVNFNSPGQVVIAGDAAAVQRAIEAAKGAGAKRALPLPVSVPSHCSLMRGAAAQLAEVLENISLQMPHFPVVHNVTVAAATSVDEIRELLVKQLYSPVRWTETVLHLQQNGSKLLIEAGPGKVLAGLTKRISRDLEALPLYDPATLDKVMEAVNG